MKQNIFIAAALLGAVNLGFIPPLRAQNPPARTYQPGFWQPIARVNPNRPIEVKIVNQTQVNLEYDLTTNIDNAPELLSSQETAVMKGFPLPAYLLINVAAGTPNSSQINLKFDLTTEGNAVTIKISQLGNDTPGNTTVNLHETGAIYIY